MENEYIDKGTLDAIQNSSSQKKKKEKQAEKKRSKVDVRLITQIVNGDILTKDQIVNHIPFIGYLSLIIVLYIGYGYHTQNVANRIATVEREIGELNSEEVTLSTDFNRLTRRLEIETLVKDRGLHESVDPPKKIQVNKE